MRPWPSAPQKHGARAHSTAPSQQSVSFRLSGGHGAPHRAPKTDILQHRKSDFGIAACALFRQEINSGCKTTVFGARRTAARPLNNQFRFDCREGTLECTRGLRERGTVRARSLIRSPQPSPPEARAGRAGREPTEQCWQRLVYRLVFDPLTVCPEH